VTTWARSVTPASLFPSSVTVLEMELGILRRRGGRAGIARHVRTSGEEESAGSHAFVVLAEHRLDSWCF
jgi:hypothetical protein